MSRHEYKNLSPSSAVIVDQTLRMKQWESAATEELASYADEPSCEQGYVLERFHHWVDAGTDPKRGPPPLEPLMSFLSRVPSQSDQTGPIVDLLALYRKVNAVSNSIFEREEHEGHLVALLDQDRFALKRIKTRVLQHMQQYPEDEVESAFSAVLAETCKGLPRLCSPGR